jgi:hypothetical protein
LMFFFYMFFLAGGGFIFLYFFVRFLFVAGFGGAGLVGAGDM